MKVEILRDVNSGQYKKGDIAAFSQEDAERLIVLGAARALEEVDALQQPEQPAPEVDVVPPVVDQPAPAAPEAPLQPTPEQIQGDLDNLEPPLEAPVAPEAPQFPLQQPEQPQA